MRHFGLIGYPLSHSFSKGYFQQKFEREGINAEYENFPLSEITELPTLLNQYPSLEGLNVTVPYKEKVMAFLNVLDYSAQAIGAVNTIKVSRNGLSGFNTDYIGFRESLRPLLKPMHTHALILGTGGSSKAVAYALAQLGIEYRLVSRNPEGVELSYSMLDRSIMQQHLLIVNCTPMGMYPEVNGAPDLPYQYLGQEHLLYDLIYNPSETPFLRKGMQAGATTKSGLEMLHLQAEAAWQIWNGSPI